MWTKIRLLLKSSLIWVHTVYRNDFQNHKQMTKQTTIVVIGALRVNNPPKKSSTDLSLQCTIVRWLLYYSFSSNFESPKPIVW